MDSLAGVVADLDKYKTLADVSVTFGFDKAVLTAADKQELDGLAGSLGSARGYILQVTGGADTTGDADYNYRLSQRRADAVVTYLSVKYGVAPHRFYLVGIGKDQQVAGGKAKNRRVDVQVLSNMTGVETASSADLRRDNAVRKQIPSGDGQDTWPGQILLRPRLRAELAVDEAHEDGRENDPGELVPVKEGEAEEGGGGAGVPRGDAKAYVGEEQEELPGGAALGGLCHGWKSTMIWG